MASVLSVHSSKELVTRPAGGQRTRHLPQLHAIVTASAGKRGILRRMATQVMPPLRAETESPTEEELAVRRLEEALKTCWRLEDAYRTAIGTEIELAAWARLRGAREEVSARERWLRWVRQDEDLLVIPPAVSLAGSGLIG